MTIKYKLKLHQLSGNEKFPSITFEYDNRFEREKMAKHVLAGPFSRIYDKKGEIMDETRMAVEFTNEMTL